MRKFSFAQPILKTLAILLTFRKRLRRPIVLIHYQGQKAYQDCLMCTILCPFYSLPKHFLPDLNSTLDDLNEKQVLQWHCSIEKSLFTRLHKYANSKKHLVQTKRHIHPLQHTTLLGGFEQLQQVSKFIVWGTPSFICVLL